MADLKRVPSSWGADRPSATTGEHDRDGWYGANHLGQTDISFLGQRLK